MHSLICIPQYTCIFACNNLLPCVFSCGSRQAFVFDACCQLPESSLICCCVCCRSGFCVGQAHRPVLGGPQQLESNGMQQLSRHSAAVRPVNNGGNSLALQSCFGLPFSPQLHTFVLSVSSSSTALDVHRFIDPTRSQSSRLVSIRSSGN